MIKNKKRLQNQVARHASGKNFEAVFLHFTQSYPTKILLLKNVTLFEISFGRISILEKLDTNSEKDICDDNLVKIR
jgi:hypothetical protein